MNLRKHRLGIAAGTLVVLGGLTYLLQVQRETRLSSANETAVDLPSIDSDKAMQIEIKPPNKEKVTLSRKASEKVWTVSSPVEAEADQDAIDSLLERFGDLKVRSVAATRSENHAALQVDDAQAVKLVISAPGQAALKLFVGDYKSGNTMIRKDGHSEVLAVSGSLRYLLDKEVKDWRDRTIVDVEEDRIRALRFTHDKVDLAFEKQEDTWVQSTSNRQSIHNFDPSQVSSLAATLAKLSAADFAAKDASAETLGFDERSPRIELQLAGGDKGTDKAEREGGVSDEDGSEQKAGTKESQEAAESFEAIVLRLGQNPVQEDRVALRRDDDTTVYLVAASTAKRLEPQVSDFEEREQGDGDGDSVGDGPQGLP